MELYFRSGKFEKLCNSERETDKELGPKVGRKLRQRLNELSAFECLADVPKVPPPRCHELTGNKKGIFSVDLQHPYRLLFTPRNDDIFKDDGGIDLKQVVEIDILRIEDTHDSKNKRKR